MAEYIKLKEALRIFSPFMHLPGCRQAVATGDGAVIYAALERRGYAWNESQNEWRPTAQLRQPTAKEED